jgi:lysophospholipase L1-like esterase
MHLRPRTLLYVLLALPLGLAALVAVEVVVALNGDYLRHADYEIDFTTSEGSGTPLRLAVLGDSLVEGVGASDAERSLPGQIASKVADQSGRAVHVTGFGVSGAVTREVFEQLDQIEPGRFDAIVIEIGSNDVTHRTRLKPLEHDTRTMLARAKELAPLVVLGSSGRLDTPIFLPPLRQIVVHRATQIREVQGNVARELDVPFMNVADDVAPTYESTAGSDSRDRFHPSDVGYEIWARPLADLVVEGIDEG